MALVDISTLAPEQRHDHAAAVGKPIIDARHVGVKFKVEHGVIDAVKDVSFQLYRGETIAVSEIVRLWTVHNQCPGGAETVTLPDVDPADGTRVHRTTYGPCAGRTAVVLYTVDGGGHTWPGGAQYLPRAVIGRTSRDIDATLVIWQYFRSHPRP